MSDDPNVFMATYTDVKIIKTRGVVQLHFEVPIDNFRHCMEVLGDAPRPDREIWVAIARLNKQAAAADPPMSKARRGHWDMKPSQRAGDRCSDVRFQEWLASIGRIEDATEEAATTYIRKVAGGSRSNLGSPGYEKQTETWDKIDRLFDEYLQRQRFGE